MKLANILVSLMILGAVATTSIILSCNGNNNASATITNDSSDIRTIHVALYDCGRNNRPFFDLLDYGWNGQNMTYRFDYTLITKDDIISDTDNSLTNDKYDVLLIGASATSYLLEGLSATWKYTIRDFVSNGGGYVGICGGANAASMGFERPTTPFQLWVNQGVLRLADVYINDNLIGEWQYVLKFGFDAFGWNNSENEYPYYISVNTTVITSPDNFVFAGYTSDYRYITYAGGPGLYSADSNDIRYGDIIPLMTYNEEPMKTKPLHFWIRTLAGWKVFANVTTDIMGSYAGIANTYGETGKVVLFGPHPEHRVVVNGTVREYLGHGLLNSYLNYDQYVFNYFGEPLSHDYNWWMIRRSVAWSAHVPMSDLPPIK